MSAANFAFSVCAHFASSDRAQAYHSTEDTQLGKPIEVVAAESSSAGPWTVTWPQTAPQLLRFKVRLGLIAGMHYSWALHWRVGS